MPIENRYQPPEEQERVIMIDEDVGHDENEPQIEPARNIPTTENPPHRQEPDDDDFAPQRRPSQDEDERRPQRRPQADDDDDDDEFTRDLPVGDKVKGRIKKLTKNWRQTQRDLSERDAEIDRLRRENQQHIARQMQGDDLVVASREEALTREEEALAREAKDAHDTGDFDASFKVQKRLAEIHIQKQRLEDVKAHRQQQRAEFERRQNAPPEQSAPQQPKVTPEAAAWLGKQEAWWGKDDVLTTAAFTIDKQVAAAGFDPNEPEYYEELDKRLRRRFPADFAEFDRQSGHQRSPQYEAPATRSRPSQPVSGVSRSPVQGGKRPVSLTAEEQNMARRIGLPAEEYAKQLAKMGRR